MKDKLEELKYYLEELKVIKREKKLYNDHPFIRTELYKVILNNRNVIFREKLIKGNRDGSAAIIIPVTEEGEILTVIEPRVFTKEGVLIGFPAGYIEEGEEPVTAAKRELEEETGYISDNLIEVDSFYQDEGCSSALNHIFLALDAKKEKEQKLDKDEIIRYMLFTYDEILELERLGYIRSANTKLAIAKTEKYIRERRR